MPCGLNSISKYAGAGSARSGTAFASCSRRHSTIVPWRDEVSRGTICFTGAQRDAKLTV